MRVPCLCFVSPSYQKFCLLTRAIDRWVGESGTAGKKKKGKTRREAEEIRAGEWVRMRLEVVRKEKQSKIATNVFQGKLLGR